jgi:fructosamine-3-kinase
MSELFGGFHPAFHAAYCHAWPVDAGYAIRRELYNLYHLLNHLNLFGSSYLARCEHTIARLLAEVR